MRWIRRLLGLSLLLGTWWVGWQFVTGNQQPVSVDYVVGHAPEVALWKVVLASFGCGAGLVALYTLWTSARSGLAARRYRKALGGLESEIHQLRNLPLAPDPDVPVSPAAAVPRARSATGRNS
jgi:hypothetical protein